jgi:ribosomal protein S18 acetylase RimI-like enzyme
MTVTIRKLTPPDAEAYVGLRSAMLQQEPLAFLASPADDLALQVDQMQARLSHAENAIFGAFAPALVGAVGVFRPTHRKAAHKPGVWGMFVLPEFRRLGLARKLMQHGIDHARQLAGATQVALSVSETAGAARGLYESLGFRVWGTEPRALQHEGRVVSEHHMVLLFE